MALAAIAYTSTPLEDYSGYWIKFYEQGTTTPKSMATDGAGGTLLAKAEISSGGVVPVGFIKTVGDAIFIPFVDGAYDQWLFPTEAEADANDTTNAIQLADDIIAPSVAGAGSSAVQEDTTTTMAANTNKTYAVGDVVQTSTGSGGGTYDVVLTSGVTPNTYDIIIGVADPLISFKLRVQACVNVKQFGAAGDGTTDDTGAIQAALDHGAECVVFPPASGYRIASPGIVVPSNIVVDQSHGKIVITSAILATSYTGAIRIETKSNVKWELGIIDVSGFATFDNNIFIVSNCTDVAIVDGHIVDSAQDRYPLGCIRSQTNVRAEFRGVKMTAVGGIGLQDAASTHSLFLFNRSIGGTQSSIETNNGNHNVYMGNICSPTSNTGFSAFSFNDKYSSCIGNVMEYGLYSITIGHAAPNEASYSSIIGNIADSPTAFCYNVQATEYASIVGNIGEGGTWGIRGSAGSAYTSCLGNVLSNLSQDGISAGSYWTIGGNVVDGFNTSAYRTFANGSVATVYGNIALNGTNASSIAYNWGIAAAQINATVTGNFAGDNQGTPTQNKGFASLSLQNNFLGNSTDGNHVTDEFDGTFSTSLNKNLTTNGAVSFTAAATSPSVADPSDLFLTADTSTYVDFFDSRGDGHTFKLIALHAATVTNNVNISTSTLANKTLTVGNLYEFTSRNGVWYENATA